MLLTQLAVWLENKGRARQERLTLPFHRYHPEASIIYQYNKINRVTIRQQKKKEIRCHLSLYYIYNIISIAYSLSYSLVPLSSNFLSQRIPPEMYIHINRDETGTNSLRIYTGVCFVSLPILHDAIWWRRQTLENKRQLCVLLPYTRGAFLLLVVCWLSFLFGCI